MLFDWFDSLTNLCAHFASECTRSKQAIVERGTVGSAGGDNAKSASRIKPKQKNKMLNERSERQNKSKKVHRESL